MTPLGSDPDLVPARPRSPGWMITFADLLSLLVSFFVLLFATTTVERRDWERVVLPISEYLTGHRMERSAAVEAPPAGRARLDLLYAAALLDKLVVDLPAFAGARVEREEHRVSLILPLLPIAHWTEAERPALTDLARLLGNFDNRVSVIAHRAANPAPGADLTRDWVAALSGANLMATALARQGYAHPLPLVAMIDRIEGGQTQIEIAIDDEPIADLPPTDGHAKP